MMKLMVVMIMIHRTWLTLHSNPRVHLKLYAIRPVGSGGMMPHSNNAGTVL
jgi:hypothetical protein